MTTDDDRHSLQFRHCGSTPAARVFSMQKNRNCIFLRLLVYFATDAEPPGKRPCVRQTTLFGQVVGKNEDNVHSHLPYVTPIVDHTSFEEGGGGKEQYESSFVCPRCANF